jgi:hypothetical protein
VRSWLLSFVESKPRNQGYGVPRLYDGDDDDDENE